MRCADPVPARTDAAMLALRLGGRAAESDSGCCAQARALASASMSVSARAQVIVVMGVAGSGKTEVARELATRLALDYLEGDHFHPAANVSKMRAGLALNDDDRWGWLDALAAAARSCTPGCVVSCSALRRAYRDRLRTLTHGPVFLFLDAPAAVVATRVEARAGHFMPASLVASQLATLERPEDEPDVYTLDATLPLTQVIAQAQARVAGLAGGPEGGG